MPSLVIRSGPLKGRRVPLRPEGVVLGRDPDPSCDVALGSGAVSGRHATVLREGGRWIVRDLDSRNGTFVNDEAVITDALLTHGARLVFGDVEATFDDPTGPTPVAPVVPTPVSINPTPAPPQRPAPPEPPPPPRPELTPRPEPTPPPPDLLRTLRMGSALLRRSGTSGAGLARRLRDATAELERAVAQRDAELTRKSVTTLLEEGGALHGLADELKAVFETTERSLDHFDKLLREVDEQAGKARR